MNEGIIPARKLFSPKDKTRRELKPGPSSRPATSEDLIYLAVWIEAKLDEKEHRLLLILDGLLQLLNKTRKQMAIKQTEIAEGLGLMRIQIGKVAAEQAKRFDAAQLANEVLAARVKELTDIIEAGGNAEDASDAVVAALADARAALQALDDVIPDAPPEPTPTEPS